MSAVRDLVAQTLIKHQRHSPASCLCGWSELGKSHTEHVAGIILPLIREAIDRSVEGEIHHAADNGHVLDWRCQGVAPGEVVPAVRVDHIRAAIRGAL